MLHMLWLLIAILAAEILTLTPSIESAPIASPNHAALLSARDLSVKSHTQTANSIRIDMKNIISRIPDGIRNGLASGLAAAVVKATLAPFDTVKTVQQLNEARVGTVAAAISVVQDRGLGALWAGTPIAILGSAPSVAFYYGVFNSCKGRIAKVLPSNCRPLAIAGAAIIGNTLASVLRVPYEVFKQRLQVGTHQTLWEAMAYSAQHEGGLLGLFGGGKLVAQIARDVPYAVITAVSYELLQAVMNMAIQLKKDKDNDSGIHIQSTTDSSSAAGSHRRRLYQDAACGAAAGGFSTFITTPLDVVKTRLMSGRDAAKYDSVGAAVRHIFKEEGREAFFRGTSSRLLHKVPANGLFFICYEFFRNLLGVGEHYKLKT